MNKWVTILELNDNIKANIVRSKLESHSILCFIKNEHMASTYKYQATSAVQVQVSSRDVPEALQVLKEMGYPIGNTVSQNFMEQNKPLLIGAGVVILISVLLMLYFV